MTVSESCSIINILARATGGCKNPSQIRILKSQGQYTRSPVAARKSLFQRPAPKTSLIYSPDPAWTMVDITEKATAFVDKRFR